MTRRSLTAAFVLALAASAATGVAVGSPDPGDLTAARESRSAAIPDGFRPAALGAPQLGRYFVVMDARAVAQRPQAAGGLSAQRERRVARVARASQSAAIARARSLGGDIAFRYDTLVNGFSANLSPEAAAAIAARPDVRTVEPVSIVQKLNETTVPFIGATEVWDRFGARGRGMTVAVVDTGIDYTHANFGGPGTVEAYEGNDPDVIEPGSFPTRKVIGGFDFVGSNYDVADDDPSNDVPQPDPDPLDADDHGSHTSGTVAGIGVAGEIGPGVAPKAKLIAIKVWDVGSSTDDVLVAGYEQAMDPNNDGSTRDAVDVLSFSGGVDYGTESSIEARAAQRVVKMGTVFVASAGNSGNQPVGGSAYITGTPANAPGVISVAASIDEFNARRLTVDSPATALPDDGLMVVQEWGPPLAGNLTNEIIDAREFDPPADPENPTGPDQMLCAPVAGTPFAGKIALIYKASSTTGDCFADDKVANAQAAGASAVVLWNGFGGLPSQIGIGGDGSNITVPVAMISTSDSEVLAATISPDAASGSFNTVATTVTLNDEESLFPQFTDAMTDFTSEGPARVSSDLKPDISAPGFDIQSTDAGTGDKGVKFSGTSMAGPHVSGVATLLRQLHPSWAPAQIKAVLMNQATQELKDNTLGEPVSATVIGAGRVQALESAKAVSVAEPASLSFGLEFASRPSSEVESFVVRNLGRREHGYTVTGGGPRYADFDPAVAQVDVSTNGHSYGASRSFTLERGKAKRVYVRLSLNPAAISEADQEDGWYYFHPNVDGNVVIEQGDHGTDTLHVPWHVAPLAVSRNSLSERSLDLRGGAADTMRLVERSAAGTSYADLYQLGATDPLDSRGEEDLVAIGARSFTGPEIGDDIAVGVPAGVDALAEIGWLDFLTNGDAPVEPVEFGVQAAAVHNTTETIEVDVLVDAGADGVYAGSDDGLAADYLIVKPAAPGGEVCVFDLSLASPFDDCAASYFADYSNYNSNLFGLAVDAGEIGLTSASPTLAYQVVACTGTFSGDVAGQLCDEAGEVGADGVYGPRLDAADPALAIDPLVCKGFWDGGACDANDPIEVHVGSAGPGSDPAILGLFPNNRPSRRPVVVSTDTG